MGHVLEQQQQQTNGENIQSWIIMRLSPKGLYYYKYSEKKQSLSKVSRLTEEEKIANSKILKRKKYEKSLQLLPIKSF